jgi:dienelactone hydrolase
MQRNLSPQQMFERLAGKHVPQFRFGGGSRAEFDQWKSAALPKVLATLGDPPPPAAGGLNPELIVEYEHDGLIKQRWWIDVQDEMSAILVIAWPKDAQPGRKLPAILCCHGHGPFGKEPVMGNASTPELRAQIEAHNYSYGHQMAKKGFVTFAIDWIGFGDRNDTNKPNHRNQAGGRDWCNIYYLHATMLGMTSLSINTAHGKAAIDFALSRPNVDPAWLGVMGLSGGGTMALWMALTDPRIRAAEVICYSDLWECFGIRDTNYCGMQVAPGLYKLVDLPDLQGLIAPRPLLVDIGIYDDCFRVDSAMPCYKRVEQIYAAAGVSDRLWLDLHTGQHGWGANRSAAFFGKYLEA